MSFKLALNAGHGLPTKGKHCLESIDPNKTKEWVLNSRICNKIEEKLKAYTGYALIRLDDITGKTDVLLKDRTDKANEFGADFYLAIHHNTGIHGGSGGGFVAYVYTKPDPESVEWQKELYDEVVKATGLVGNRSEPLNSANFHECRESKMPSVLLECGFMDSTVDTPIILTEEYADKVAESCVKVIVRRAKLVKKTNTTSTTTSTKTETNVTYFKKYNGTTNSIVSALNSIGEKSDFTYRSEIAKINGIKDYKGTAAQNTTMLSLLKGGKLIKSKTATTVDKPVVTITYFKKYSGLPTSSIVSALKRIGEKSDFDYRSKIAKVNGIASYTGTATQNTNMLTLLKKGKLIKP